GRHRYYRDASLQGLALHTFETKRRALIARRPKQGEPRHAGNELSTELKEFGGQIAELATDSRDPASRTREALHQSGLDRVADAEHDDGHALGMLFQYQCRRRRRRDDHINARLQELAHESRQDFVTARRISVLEFEVDAFDIAVLAQASDERCENRRGSRRGGVISEIPDPIHFPSLLRPQPERRSEELSHGSREGATVHSITRSARSSTDGGMVRPRAFAVLRLITSSYFVGCSTGRSAGLAPLRILST